MPTVEIADLRERTWVSRFSGAGLGLAVYVGGELVDADALPTAAFVDESDDSQVALSVGHPETGRYTVNLTSVHTDMPGLYKVTWSYEVGGDPNPFEVPIEVGPDAPAYDALNDDFKGVVEAVWVKLADAYDSPRGGPYLQTLLQSHFHRGRVAQLLHSVVGDLNVIAQPHMTYSITGPKVFPVAKWGALLEMGLYIEVIRHLIRSYTEQTEVTNVSVSRVDRRDYAERWRAVLNDEREDFEAALSHFKMAHLGLSKIVVTVGGGAYGAWSETIRWPNPARPRFWYRHH